MIMSRKTSIKLRDMNNERALAHCANITKAEWTGMDDEIIIELWTVFRSYIANGFQGSGLVIPARIGHIWGRCKVIIDKEARR